MALRCKRQPLCMQLAAHFGFCNNPCSWSQEPPAYQSISFIPCSLTIHDVKRSNGYAKPTFQLHATKLPLVVELQPYSTFEPLQVARYASAKTPEP